MRGGDGGVLASRFYSPIRLGHPKLNGKERAKKERGIGANISDNITFPTLPPPIGFGCGILALTLKQTSREMDNDGGKASAKEAIEHRLYAIRHIRLLTPPCRPASRAELFLSLALGFESMLQKLGEKRFDLWQYYIVAPFVPACSE